MRRRLCIVLSLVGAPACRGPELYGVRAPLDGAGAQVDPSLPAARLLSAHLSLAPAGDLVQLLLVFSTEVDPTTVEAEAFVVVLESGEFVVPERALLDPADEVDENRTLTLLGRFGAPTGDPPASVRVIGGLYAEDGRSLEGLDATVRPYEAADDIVSVELLRPAEHRCRAARQVVRTYWSDNLRGIGEDDLPRIRVSFTDGSEVAPIGFDDHADLGDSSPAHDDNVLDLCLGRDAPVTSLSVPAGLFTDAGGHPSGACTRGPGDG